MADLLPRLLAATEGSRDLSDEVLLDWGWKRWTYGFVTPDDEPQMRDVPRPDPTRSIDDALRGMPEGAEYEITTLYGVAHVALPLNFTDLEPQYGERKDGNVALALCIAITRARMARKEEA